MINIPGKKFYYMLMKIFKLFSPIKFKFVGTLGEDILQDFRNKFLYTDFSKDICVIHVCIFFKSVLCKFKYLSCIISDKNTIIVVNECIEYIEEFLKILNNF